MTGDHIALLIVCALLVVEQAVHFFQARAYRRHSEMLTKMLAARNYTEYSIGEARQEKVKHPETDKSYERGLSDG